MRCARLLQEIGEDRSRRLSLTGNDQIVEVYPAASLTAWGGAAAGFNPRGYKDRSARKPVAKQARAHLVVSFLAETHPWLEMGADDQQKCVDSDNELDALIAALTTRASQLGMIREPTTDHQRKLAAIEGWIHVPKPGSLPLLGAGAGT